MAIKPSGMIIKTFLEEYCSKAAKELIPGYLTGITGTYQTPQSYYVDDADVEEFDKAFPRKEKLRLPGQIF